MTEQTQPDEPFTSVRGLRAAALQDLKDLRFVGASTAETLADSAITAADIRDQAVSYIQLVELGVDPGVASKLRREYSLPWSAEPTEGARLRRRAQHIRHLRDDERSWIDESWTPAADAAPAATDGSGRAADSVAAWRERGRQAPRTEPWSRSQTGSSAISELPVDPSGHTVPELEAALEYEEDPDALAAVLRAERAGEARTTAVDAIERRLLAVGIDPDRVNDGTSEARAAVGGHSEILSAPRQRVESIRSGVDIDSELDEWLRDSQRAVRDRAAVLGQTVRHELTRIRTLEPDEWRRLSMALLVGLVGFGITASLITAVAPTTNAPATVLSLFLVTSVTGLIGLPLRYWDDVGGYALSLLTGLLGLTAVGVIAATTDGTGNLATTSITLTAFGLIAASLLTTAYLSAD